MDGNAWRDFLAFRKHITPIVMPVVFLIGVAITVIIGLVTIIEGARAWGVVAPRLIAWGIIVLFEGPVFVHIVCEVVMTFFRRAE